MKSLYPPMGLIALLLLPWPASACPKPLPTGNVVYCCAHECLSGFARQPDMLADSLYLAAECLLEQGEYQAVAAALETAVRQPAATRGRDGRWYFLLGKAHRELHNLNQSTAYFAQALECFEEAPNRYAPALRIEAYRLSGLNYYDKEDYLPAIEYFGIALDGIKQHKLKQRAAEIALRQHLGNCYRFLGKYAPARKNFELALGLAYDYHDYTTHQAARLKVYRDLGALYLRFGLYRKAHYALNKSIRFSTQLYGERGLEAAKGLEVLSQVCYREGRYREALGHARLAWQGMAAHYGDRSPQAARLTAQMGACLSGLERFEAADQHLNRALAIMSFDPRRRHPFEGYEAWRRPLADMLYFKALNHQKAYEAGRGEAHLDRAGSFFSLCASLVEHINASLEDSGAKPYLLHDFYHVFEGAIHNCYERYKRSGQQKQVEEAFAFAERSKAILLKEAVQKAGAETREGIPPALLAEYRQSRQEVIRLENQRYECQQRGEEELAQELGSHIFQAKRACYLLEDSLRRGYPQYYQLKQSPPPLSLAELQIGLLAPGQALVQYFVGQERIFIFALTPEEAFLVSVPNDAALEQAVLDLREDIYGWLAAQTEEQLARYHAHAHYLYQQLIVPIERFLPESLIIIPDGTLEYLPFEALLTAMPDSAALLQSHAYLLQRYQISYAHSARLLAEMKDRSLLPPQHRRALAFAPSFEPAAEMDDLPRRRSSLGALYSNTEEVMHVKKTLNARVRKGKAATRERFLREAHRYSILHLATHAKANDTEGEYSYLAFTRNPSSPDRPLLYAKELYALQLPAEMAVLSACETGVGELRRGEGAISLARGFAHAGTRSLVATLWRVSDKETADFMRLFYENLQQKMPKDAALHQAKLSYLSEAPPDKAHPFFWAAFTLCGDMSPIITSAARPRWMWYAVGAGMLLVALAVGSRGSSMWPPWR